MKMNARDLSGFIRKPDIRARAGILLYGPDAGRIALKRGDLLEAVLGQGQEADMALTRFAAQQVRSDPAQLVDAMHAQGFFGGQSVVLLEDATDTLAKAVAPALEARRDGDAFLVVTAGQLTARSALRKLFEKAENAYACPLYADPPGRGDVEDALAHAHLPIPGEAAFTALIAQAQGLTPGDFRQLLEKIALYKRNDSSELTPDEVALLAPATQDAALDDAIHALANGDVPGLSKHLARLMSQGVNPTTLCISATRHFQTLFRAASAGGRPEDTLSRQRPPVFGPRRDLMAAQIRGWGRPGLERVLQLLMEVDLQLRSASNAPQMAVLERAFLRIAMLRARG